MKCFIVFAMLALSTSAFSQPKFLFPEEGEKIEHKFVGNVEVLVLEDFVNNSIEPAKIIAIEGDLLLIRREGLLALIVPENRYDLISEDPFVTLPGTCSEQCGEVTIGGALAGALAGASQGAEAGTPFGPQGAAGGVVLGGLIGGVAGGMSAWGLCKIATQCGALPMVPGKGG